MYRDITGGCLCGKVKFELKDDFRRFFFCHCKQCRQLSGAAFAANLFTTPNNVKWTQGESNISLYSHATKNISNAFCSSCGSRLPALHKSGLFLVVPIGSLDSEPSKTVDANIFVEEKASWFEGGVVTNSVKGFDGQSIPHE